MLYSTYRIIRTKDISNDYFEVILQGKREIAYKPGNCLAVKHPENDEYSLYLIASGVHEPWVRILVPVNDKIINRDSRPKLRVARKLVPIFPDLMEAKNPIFLCASVGISIYLSYISTFPEARPKLYALEGVPNEEYIKNYPQAQIIANLDELNNIKFSKKDTYYICAPKKSAQAMKKLLTSADITNIKWIEL